MEFLQTLSLILFMKNNFYSFLAFLFIPLFSFAQQDNSYQFTVDLTKVHSDLLSVNLITPKISTDTIIYHFPAMVPGTYKVYDFGKWITNFKALDNTGK